MSEAPYRVHCLRTNYSPSPTYSFTLAIQTRIPLQVPMNVLLSKSRLLKPRPKFTVRYPSGHCHSSTVPDTGIRMTGLL